MNLRTRLSIYAQMARSHVVYLRGRGLHEGMVVAHIEEMAADHIESILKDGSASLKLMVDSYVKRLRERAKFNQRWAAETWDNRDDHLIIARVQEEIADLLQYFLEHYDQEENSFYLKENTMNAVKSLAGTGRTYCAFIVRVSGGTWGEPRKYQLVEKSGGGCGEPYGEKLTTLGNFAFPVDVPAGDYQLQMVRNGGSSGGCGGYVTGGVAHIQFATKNGGNARNRSYGFAWDSTSKELLARL